jgi:hypothetical protein
MDLDRVFYSLFEVSRDGKVLKLAECGAVLSEIAKNPQDYIEPQPKLCTAL